MNKEILLTILIIVVFVYVVIKIHDHNPFDPPVFVEYIDISGKKT